MQYIIAFTITGNINVEEKIKIFATFNRLRRAKLVGN